MSQAQSIHIAEQLARIVGSSAENEAAFERNMAEALEKRTGAPMPNLSIAECHVIEAIGSTPDITAARISEQLSMTRGGVSKIIKRLESKGYIATAAKDRNKKELHLELTPAGQEAFKIHEKLHRAKINSLTRVLSTYTDEELDVAIRMLQDLINFQCV